jgi:hypothetical protein
MAHVFSKQKRPTLRNQALNEISKLEAIVQSMVQASENEDMDRLISEDLRFH